MLNFADPLHDQRISRAIGQAGFVDPVRSRLDQATTVPVESPSPHPVMESRPVWVLPVKADADPTRKTLANSRSDPFERPNEDRADRQP